MLFVIKAKISLFNIIAALTSILSDIKKMAERKIILFVHFIFQ